MAKRGLEYIRMLQLHTSLVKDWLLQSSLNQVLSLENVLPDPVASHRPCKWAPHSWPLVIHWCNSTMTSKWCFTHLGFSLPKSSGPPELVVDCRVEIPESWRCWWQQRSARWQRPCSLALCTPCSRSCVCTDLDVSRCQGQQGCCHTKTARD